MSFRAIFLKGLSADESFWHFLNLIKNDKSVTFNL
ncbi:unknown protein [Simkania negevensis Z]|uniref:Uncharacterized protein n=1 Tax=Simkania negevensis (strain ATCC VR-1471 / DSM 27360 / Z) TaxID=331113 RepID=F8L4G0_SIMNZ|nr:unknown protein [Simkania negevensis Z]